MSGAESEGPRERQAALQAALMRALTGIGPGQGALPAGFDADRVRAASASLATKRARGVARSWPALARALGADFGPIFAAYAGSTPLPSFGGPLRDGRAFAAYAGSTPLPCIGGPLRDGRAFADHLERLGRLPDSGRLERLAVDLRAPRRFPRLGVARLGTPRRLVLALRWPGLGEWWGAISMPCRQEEGQ